ncbi:MAG: hypothetical protein ACTSVO_13525 [Candidatus Heimdallarchaeaceae archaeon]
MTEVVEMKDKKSKHKLLDEWVAKLIFPGAVKDFIQVKSEFAVGGDGEHYKEISFYTEENKYSIIAIEREKDDGYLGCGVTCRKVRPGEEWHRGNDLPDGPFTEETWNTIIYAIVNYELVKLSKFQRPDQIPDINA